MGAVIERPLCKPGANHIQLVPFRLPFPTVRFATPSARYQSLLNSNTGVRYYSMAHIPELWTVANSRLAITPKCFLRDSKEHECCTTLRGVNAHV